MTKQTNQSGYTISRNDASKIMKISVRTLDRHIKNGNISAKETEGRVFLSMLDINDFLSKKTVKNKKNVYRQNREKTSRQKSNFVYTKKPNFSSPKAVVAEKNVYRQIDEKNSRQNDEFVYTTEDEFPIKSSPLCEEVNIENPELEDLKKQLKENIEFQHYKERALLGEISTIKSEKDIYEQKLRLEKIKKRFFLFILLLIIAFQPIWIYLFLLK